MVAMRIMPSGFVHQWGATWLHDAKPWRTSACGITKPRSRLTIHYPPKGRHCPTCFPEGAP